MHYWVTGHQIWDFEKNSSHQSVCRFSFQEQFVNKRSTWRNGCVFEPPILKLDLNCHAISKYFFKKDSTDVVCFYWNYLLCPWTKTRSIFREAFRLVPLSWRRNILILGSCENLLLNYPWEKHRRMTVKFTMLKIWINEFYCNHRLISLMTSLLRSPSLAATGGPMNFLFTNWHPVTGRCHFFFGVNPLPQPAVVDEILTRLNADDRTIDSNHKFSR